MKETNQFRFQQIYQMPGEGLIAELRCGNETRLFGLDGLQYRLVQRRNSGESTVEEEKALAIFSNLTPSS